MAARLAPAIQSVEKQYLVRTAVSCRPLNIFSVCRAPQPRPIHPGQRAQKNAWSRSEIGPRGTSWAGEPPPGLVVNFEGALVSRFEEIISPFKHFLEPEFWCCPEQYKHTFNVVASDRALGASSASTEGRQTAVSRIVVANEGPGYSKVYVLLCVCDV